MTRIELTQAMQDALAALDQAERVYVPGRDSSAIVELPKLALADAVLAAIQAQRTKRLPRRADAGVVYVRLQPISRKRRA